MADTTASLQERLTADIQAAGILADGEAAAPGCIGMTMFDHPGSEDGTLTVLLPQDKAQLAPSQSLIRIRSRKGGDGRSYLGIVTAGPFAEPDNLAGDSPMLVTVAARGGVYLPPYHGRVQVTILGEELADGTLVPPRLRPLPNCPVFALTSEESAKVLKTAGDIRLGLVVGYDAVPIGVPSDAKAVLPRHTAILGTTGGGKSTTVARLIQQAQAANMSVILLDVEGEYTHLHEPTTNAGMLRALSERGLKPLGVPADRMTIYHLVGRDTANPDHPHVRPFSLQFARLSPYAAAEILGLSEAQQLRFMQAYDIAKQLMRELFIFPAKGNQEHERILVDIDEFERGYPRLTLSFLIDVVTACKDVADAPKKERGQDSEIAVELNPFNQVFKTPEGMRALKKRIAAAGKLDSPVSWRALLARLWQLHRLKVFDVNTTEVQPLIYNELLRPGAVSVIDLSSSGMSELNNIVISDLLRGVQEAQDAAYEQYQSAKGANGASPTTRTLIIIEEAHEFLSEERIDKQKILFEQVARIAKRGRKRWLGLVFVTQLPQHLPRQVFGLVNSYVLHKITDPHVVATLRKTVGGIDDSLWNRLSALAPGQAIVSFPHMARPLLASIDPTPAELRMVD